MSRNSQKTFKKYEYSLRKGKTSNYSHFKLYWKTFSAPNASYSNKYLSQYKFKKTIFTG